MLKQNKGITLVALVITIIVLLILAGVSISMVVGQNGVLNRATNAAEKTADAEIKSALENAIVGAQGDFVGEWEKNPDTKFTKWLTGDELEGNLDNTVYTVTYSGTETKGSGTIARKAGNTKTYNFDLTPTTGNLGAKIEWK